MEKSIPVGSYLEILINLINSLMILRNILQYFLKISGYFGKAFNFQWTLVVILEYNSIGLARNLFSLGVQPNIRKPAINILRNTTHISNEKRLHVVFNI